jgi:hypothetical protein
VALTYVSPRQKSRICLGVILCCARIFREGHYHAFWAILSDLVVAEVVFESVSPRPTRRQADSSLPGRYEQLLQSGPRGRGQPSSVSEVAGKKVILDVFLSCGL